MVIFKKMVFFFRENLEDLIDKRFSPVTNKFSERAMEEDPVITSKRKKLQGSIDSFTESMQILKKLKM